jgi:hypothetical protein
MKKQNEISIYCNPQEKELIALASKLSGLSMAAYLRQVGLLNSRSLVNRIKLEGGAQNSIGSDDQRI